jgi:hypothetical protein
MFALKWLLAAAGIAMFGTAAGVVAYDVYLATQFQELMIWGQRGAAGLAGARRPIRWPLAVKLFVWGFVPMLLALNIAMLPDGSGGTPMGQSSIPQAGLLLPGLHLALRFGLCVTVYELRDTNPGAQIPSFEYAPNADAK